MSPLRKWLCTNRTLVRLASAVILTLAVGFVCVTWLSWDMFSGDTRATVYFGAFYGLVIGIGLAVRCIVRFSEWRFRLAFACDPPQKKQIKARSGLFNLVQDALLTSAARYQALVDLHRRINADKQLEEARKTPAGGGRAEAYDRILGPMWADIEKLQKRFDVAHELAVTFGFGVDNLEGCLHQISASEQAGVLLAQPEEVARS